MKRVLIVVAVLLLACSLSIALAAKGGAAAGKAVYAKKCAMCHGADGEGKEGMFKMVKAELRHLGSKEVQSKTDADLAKVITQGSGKMKPVAGLTPPDVDNLVAFVRTLKAK